MPSNRQRAQRQARRRSAELARLRTAHAAVSAERDSLRPAATAERSAPEAVAEPAGEPARPSGVAGVPDRIINNIELAPNVENPQPSRPPLRVEDALAYLDRIKAAFPSRPDKYNSFLDIMKDFKAQEFGTDETIARVIELFGEERDLILGFDTFLPPGYSIELPEAETWAVRTPSGGSGRRLEGGRLEARHSTALRPACRRASLAGSSRRARALPIS